MPPPGSVAPAEPALERWRVQHLRRRVEAVARYSDHADGPEKMGVVVVVAPLAAAPLFPGAFPRRSALAPPAIEDHLGGVAVAETLPEELEELGPLGRHDIEVTTRRGHGDKRRRFAPNLPEALPWEAMRPRPRGEPSKPGDRESAAERFAVELLRVASHEQVADQEHGHFEKPVVVHEVPCHVRFGEGRAQAHERVAHLDDHAPRAAGQREGRRVIYRCVLHQAVLVGDTTPREILPRPGAGRSAGLVIEDRHRAPLCSRILLSTKKEKGRSVERATRPGPMTMRHFLHPFVQGISLLARTGTSCRSADGYLCTDHPARLRTPSARSALWLGKT